MSAEEMLLQLFSDALQKTRAKKTKQMLDSKRMGSAPPMEGGEAPEMDEAEMKLVLELESESGEGEEEKTGEGEGAYGGSGFIPKRRKSMLG